MDRARGVRGQPVTRQRFLSAFNGPTWDGDYGQDLLDELTRRDSEGRQLAEIDAGDRLGITQHAQKWIDGDDFWRQTFVDLAGHTAPRPDSG